MFRFAHVGRYMLPRSITVTRAPLSRSAGAKRQFTLKNPSASKGTDRNDQTFERFWKDVQIEKYGESCAITLDHRPLKTPSGNKLLLPKNKALVASLIAIEWDNQEKMIKPHALSMTSLAARAIDACNEKATRDEIHGSLLKFLDTDTICFYQTQPEHLVALQAKHWDPLHDWIREACGVELNKTDSFFCSTQPEKTRQKMSQILEELDQWELAAMERATLTTKSFIIALALVKRRLSPEEACLAAHVEVNSQIERWGEVEDTHDVDYHNIRTQLGGAACLISAL